MKKFVIVLKRESGNYIFLGIGVLLFVLISTSWVFIFGWVGYLLWLSRRSRFWVMVISIVCVGIVFRCIALEGSYQSVSSFEGEATVLSSQPYHMVVGTKVGRFVVQSNASFDIGTVLNVHLIREEVDELELPHSTAKKWMALRQFQRGFVRFESYEVVGKRFVIELIREAVLRWMDHQFEETNARMLKRLLLADSSEDGEFIDSIQRLGIAHLFALSGMHLAFFLKILHHIWKRLFLPMHHYWMVQSLFLMGYLMLTNFPISLLRACVMASLLLLPNQSFLSRLDGLVVAFVGMILVNPLWFGQVGFQLSFLVTGVLLLSHSSASIPLWKQSLHMATYAFLWTLPLSTQLQGGFHLLSIPFNLVFSLFMMMVYLPLAFITALLPHFQMIFSLVSSLFFRVIEYFDQLPLFLPIVLEKSILWAFYAIVLFRLMARFQRRQSIVQSSLLLGSIVILMTVQSAVIQPSKVLFLDVNQGDATLIMSPSCTVLIDTGYPFVADYILNELRKEQRQSIDYLWITHRHYDHDGGIHTLSEQIEIRHLIVNQRKSSDPAVPTTIAKIGDVITCGEQVYQVYHDDEGHSNENDNSLVIHLSLHQKTFLFTGDLETLQEQHILSSLPSVDYYQVGHHGSITSSSEAFLEAISPSRTIISVGRANSFGHPHPAIVSRLEATSDKLHRTDERGSFQVSWVGNGLFCFEEQIQVAWVPWFSRLSTIDFCARKHS